MAIIANRREEPAKVLPEADTGFFRDAGGVGIYGLEKILDLLKDLDLPTALRGDRTWLDVTLHFRLHSCSPRRNLA